MNRFERRSGVIMASAFAALCFHSMSSVAGVVAYTDRAAFLAAVGGSASADDFESHALGAIGSGATLGDFSYSFAATVQPMVVPGGYGGRALGGPFDAFVGGDSISVIYGGATALRAFGLDVLYAPSFETIPADLYRIQIGDGSSAGAAASNSALDSAGGFFFLGLVADAGSEFRQVDLLSVVPLDADGFPLLVPAYQLDDFAYAGTSVAPVPEPSTLALMLTGFGLLAARRRLMG